MRNLLVVVGVFAASLLYLNMDRGDYSILPRASATSVEQEQFFEIDELYDRRIKFETMTEPGAYTIIEVYADNCGKCKVLEAKFPALLRQRDDIVIKRVRTFSGSISFDTQAAAEKFFNRHDGMMNFYQVKGTPHVEIYDTRGGALAQDNHGRKPGTALLNEILRASS